MLTLSADRTLFVQGTTATVTATVKRRGAFDGDVNVALQGLPGGVAAAPVLIPRGATSATITLQAQADAPHSLPTAASARGSAGTQAASRSLTVTVGGHAGAVNTGLNGGAQITAIGDGEACVRAMAVQPDGKVITVGRTSTTAGGADVAITRHRRDGTLDPAFGSGGKVVTAVAPGCSGGEGHAVMEQANGKTVVGGDTDASGTNEDFLLLRYLPDSRLDTAFGDGGKCIVEFDGGSDQVYALVQQADGRLVAGGTLHTLFTSTTGSTESVLVTPGNRIVIGGHIGDEFSRAQLAENGQPDAGVGDELG